MSKKEKKPAAKEPTPNEPEPKPKVQVFELAFTETKKKAYEDRINELEKTIMSLKVELYETKEIGDKGTVGVSWNL